ncbi:hypothetical protein U1Q18_015489 [Sarracenia purpurea var. burkii]
MVVIKSTTIVKPEKLWPLMIVIGTGSALVQRLGNSCLHRVDAKGSKDQTKIDSGCRSIDDGRRTKEVVACHKIVGVG